nr:MAG TPA: hypothetical protein [Caudoviricetes sp.]
MLLHEPTPLQESAIAVYRAKEKLPKALYLSS